jgi:hypothetical protein
MRALHKKFLKSSSSRRFTLDEVCRKLMEDFQAEMIGKNAFEDLKDDPYVNFDHITQCFYIPKNVVDELRSDSEKVEHEEMVKLISKRSWSSEEEKELALREATGTRIILESMDRRYVDNWTIQGGSESLLTEMIYLQGIDPTEYSLDNEHYLRYLTIINEKGVI